MGKEQKQSKHSPQYVSINRIARRAKAARMSSGIDGKNLAARGAYIRISTEWRKGFDASDEIESDITYYSPLAYAVGRIIVACLSCLDRMGITQVDRLLDSVLCELETNGKRGIGGVSNSDKDDETDLNSRAT